jgi:putative membrane protein
MMTVRLVFAVIHLLGLGIGLGSIWARYRALRVPLVDAESIKRVLYADNFWGLAAIIWIITGVARAFAGLEKGSDYYVNNTLFILKMLALLGIFVLEVAPMVTFIRWRIQSGRRQTLATDRAPLFATFSLIQTGLVVLMVICAVLMARGMDV